MNFKSTLNTQSRVGEKLPQLVKKIKDPIVSAVDVNPDECLAVRLNRYLSSSGKSLRDITEETQIPLLWLASVKNGTLTLAHKASEDLKYGERLEAFLASREKVENGLFIPRFIRL